MADLILCISWNNSGKVGLRSIYRRCRFWQKSSFQIKLILILAGMQTSKIVAFETQKTRTHTLKSRRTRNDSLFGPEAKLGHFSSKMSKERPLQAMAIVISLYTRPIILTVKSGTDCFFFIRIICYNFKTLLNNSWWLVKFQWAQMRTQLDIFSCQTIAIDYPYTDMPLDFENSNKRLYWDQYFVYNFKLHSK